MQDDINNETEKTSQELHAKNSPGNDKDKFHAAYNDYFLEILDQAPALIWRAATNTECDWFNTSWLKFTGRPMRQEYGNGWTEGVHPDDLSRCIDIYLAAFKKHEAFEMEYRLRRYDGEYRWILDLGKPYNSIDGEFAGYIGYCFDITERKNVDSEQKASIERLESLVRVSHFTNHSMQELLDYSLHEAVRLTSSKIGYIYFYDEVSRNFILNSWSKNVMKECEVVNPQTCYELEKTGLWGEAVRQRRPIIINDYPAENPHKKGYPQGHVKLSRFLTIPIIDKEKIVCVVGVANKETDYHQADILQLTLLLQSAWRMTERIRAEEELVKAKTAAEGANRAKSDFLASMSHEIRTPMNGILGIVSLMMENEENDQKQESLRIIRSSATSLMNLISNILDFSKIEAGQMSLSFSDFSLKNEIEEVIKLLSSSASIKGLHMEAQYSKDLPEHFCSDANRIRQILLNLLGNSVKFTDHGSIFIDVDCVTRSKKTAVMQISIEDTGIGIPQDKMPFLFKRFSKLTPATRKIEGTGLGLAITKDLVEKLGGNCRVESTPGVGSVFRVELPLALAESHIEAKFAPEPESEINANLSPQKRKRELTHILVVDDVEINVKVICLMLERLGLKAEIARNGREAVEMAAKKFYDLILMDCFMPAMDGYEATRKIREHEKKTGRRSIIVAITANAVEQGRKKCIESGMDDCIFKPVEFEIIRKFIEKLF